MRNRLDLQSKLEELLGTRNVYHDPPGTMKMQYTAIKYSKSNITTRSANDKKYLHLTRYELIVISKKPDDPVINKLLELPYCSYDRHYVADNLHHDTLTIYI